MVKFDIEIDMTIVNFEILSPGGTLGKKKYSKKYFGKKRENSNAMNAIMLQRINTNWRNINKFTVQQKTSHVIYVISQPILETN